MKTEAENYDFELSGYERDILSGRHTNQRNVFRIEGASRLKSCTHSHKHARTAIKTRTREWCASLRHERTGPDKSNYAGIDEIYKLLSQAIAITEHEHIAREPTLYRREHGTRRKKTTNYISQEIDLAPS